MRGRAWRRQMWGWIWLTLTLAGPLVAIAWREWHLARHGGH